MQEPPARLKALLPVSHPEPGRDYRAASATPAFGTAAQIRRLQRGIGNRATARLLARQADAVPESDLAMEIEADRIAAGQTVPPPDLGGGDIEALDAARRRLTLPPDLEAALSGPGRVLDPAMAARFEARLGIPLSAVRIHTGPAADSSAASRGARAYAFGQDIVFRSHEYAPHTAPGQALLGHELAHVAQQAAGGRAILARQKAPDAPVVDAVTLAEWERNPPDARLSVSLGGIRLSPTDGQFFILPDQQRAPTAVMLKRLAGAGYDKALIDKFNASVGNNAPWKPSDPRITGILMEPVFARFALAIIEKQLKLKTVITDQQRSLLAVGEALNPVPAEIWQEMSRIERLGGPGNTKRHFLAKRQRVLNQLAALWWNRTQAYTEAFQRWRADNNAETLGEAGGMFLDLINEFDIYEFALLQLHDDATLVDLPAWQAIWPKRKGAELPALTEFDDTEAAIFVQYAASQTPELLGKLDGNPDLRRSLLIDYGRYRGELNAGEGDQAVSAEPSRYNADALPVNMSAYPQPEPPLFAVGAGATTTFSTSVGFTNTYEALSNAFAGWFYQWSVARVPGDQVKNLNGFEKLAKWHPSQIDVLEQDVGRDIRYAQEDEQRMRGIAALSDILGPPGLNSRSTAGLNLLMDIAGSFLHSVIRALTKPQNEFDVPFSDPGLYVVMCYVGPKLDDTAKYVQFRRAPSIAWLPVYAKPPQTLALERSRLEIAGRKQAEDQLAYLRKLKAGDPAFSDLTPEERASLPTEITRLDLGLHGSMLEILHAQLADLRAQRERIKGGQPSAEDVGVSLKSVDDSIEETEIKVRMREERATALGAKPYRLTSVLAPDQGPVKILTIEAAQVGTSKPGEAPRWYVSDLTGNKSGHEEAAGTGALVPGHPIEDSVMTALKKLLEGGSGYARGYLSVTFPPELTLPGEGGQILTMRIAEGPEKIAVHFIESLSTLLSIAAVVAAPFTAGASLVLLMPAGLIGALPSAYRLVHRYEMGTFRFDIETASDIVNIAASIAQVGELGAGAKAVAKAGTTAGLRWAVVEGSLWIAGLGINGFGMLLMGKGLVDQIEATADLPPGLRAARIAEIMGNAMLQAGIQAGVHFASSHYLKGVEAGVRGVHGGEAPGTRPVLAPEFAAHGRPSGRSEPPPALADALPPVVRRTTPLDVDPKLQGGTVHVEYAIGANGRVDPGSIRIVAGQHATPRDITLHAETARTLHAYAGMLGAVHEGIQSLKGILQGHRAPKQGSSVLEAQMEMAKLDGILRDRLKTVSTQTVDEQRAGELAADIANLQDQLAAANRILAGIDAADPRGFIAAESAEQRGTRLTAENREVMAAHSIDRISIRNGKVVVEPYAAGPRGQNPAPGYSFRETQNGPVLSRLKLAGNEAPLMLVEHEGKLYVAPGQPEGSTVGAAAYHNNIAAQLDGYPSPKRGHHWAPDRSGGWQLERNIGYDGTAMRIAKEGGKPVKTAGGEFSFVERPERPSFSDRLDSALDTQPAPKDRSKALEKALDKAEVSGQDRDRAILRRWSELLGVIGEISSESSGMNVPSEGEVSRRAVEALSSQLGPDHTYTEGRYNDFRYALRDAAVAAIFGLDPKELGAFVNNDKKLPRIPRSAADQRALYERLYAAMPDNASKGELWSSYRETRGRLAPQQGGFRDFERIDVKTFVLEKSPETRIDGGLRIREGVKARGVPPPGEYAVESKGGDSFSSEQSERYSDNLAKNGGKLKGEGGAEYEGVFYMFDNETSAVRVAQSLDRGGRNGKLFVAYIDSNGTVRWVDRTIKPSK